MRFVYATYLESSLLLTHKYFSIVCICNLCIHSLMGTCVVSSFPLYKTTMSISEQVYSYILSFLLVIFHKLIIFHKSMSNILWRCQTIFKWFHDFVFPPTVVSSYLNLSISVCTYIFMGSVPVYKWAWRGEDNLWCNSEGPSFFCFETWFFISKEFCQVV